MALTVLVGQVMLGWADDLADRSRDARRSPDTKPLASGRIEPGSVWFAFTVALLVVVPLSVAHGPRGGVAYLASLGLALVGDRFLHATALSPLPWMASFALYPAFLAYGGWGGVGETTGPTVAMTVLAALLGRGGARAARAARAGRRPRGRRAVTCRCGWRCAGARHASPRGGPLHRPRRGRNAARGPPLGLTSAGARLVPHRPAESRAPTPPTCEGRKHAAPSHPRVPWPRPALRRPLSSCGFDYATAA